MRVYISGQISGLPLDEAKRKFDEAEALLLEYGHTPVNPFKNGLELDAPWIEHITADLKALSQCDAILVLPIKGKSYGAEMELLAALKLDLHIFDLGHFSHKHKI